MQADLFQECPNGGPCICKDGPFPGGMIAGDRCGLGPAAYTEVAPGFEEFAAQAAEQTAAGRGLRFNQGKVRVDLLPPDAIWMLAQLMTVNEAKYPDRNWEKGMPLSDVIASLERHVMALKAGEDIDPTDNQPHAVKIMWNGMALAAYLNRGIGTDDRVKCGLPDMRPLPNGW